MQQAAPLRKGRRRIGRLAAGAVLAIAFQTLAACATGAEVSDPDRVEASPPQIEAGRVMANRLCSSCHAIGRKGRSPLPDAPPLRTLSQSYPVSSLAEALAEGILTGHSDMPEFTLSQEEITSLIGYLQSIQVSVGD
jgi:mono/diheme cytochrome c family protein